MAGNKTIYLVYDQKVEDEGSLQRFISNVLTKAGFPIASIYLISSAQVNEKITQGLDQYFICLNKTYPTTTIRIASANQIPTFEFFTKMYTGNRMITLNLPYSIDEIFRENNNKKIVWAQLQEFLSTYKDFMDTSEDEIVVKDVIVPCVEVIDNYSTKVDIVESIVEEISNMPITPLIDTIIESPSQTTDIESKLKTYFILQKELQDYFNGL